MKILTRYVESGNCKRGSSPFLNDRMCVISLAAQRHAFLPAASYCTMAAASGGSAKPLQTAMRLVKAAIQLDTGNRRKEAYCEYLRSVNFISQALIEDAASNPEKEMVAVEVEKMVKLAEQCLERVKSFIGKKNETPVPDSAAIPVETPALKTGSVVVETLGKNEEHKLQPDPRHRRVLSEGGSANSPFLPPEVFQQLQAVGSADKKQLTPIEEASRLNQKLKATYEARMARLPPGQATQKTSLTLSLQRQMMENLIIARARQDALQRKMEERRLRLQEEANRRFAASGTITPEEQEQRLLYANVLEYEQDHDWPKVWKANLKKNPGDAALVSGLVNYLLSCPDHPVVKLLKRLQYRVYNRLYPLVIQATTLTPAKGVLLKPSRSVQSLLNPEPPQNPPPAVAHSLSDASLSLSHEHSANEEEADGEEQPSSLALDRENSFEDLEQFLTQLDWVPDEPDPDTTFYPTHGTMELHIRDLEERALKEHLKAIVKDIHNAIDRLLSLCLLSFECLNTASSKDHCVACIEEVFFAPIWNPLLALFRKVYREREVAFEKSARLYHDATPADIGVPTKLFPADPSALRGSYPYEAAVQELKTLCGDCCPQRKLECIVRTLRLICVCAEDYRGLPDSGQSSETAAIGADDLLPILTFVALRSEQPQLVSECAALEEFIHEGYLIGEEGYCLTSMRSALSYVESLHVGETSLPAFRLP
ncbi:VPS9 domain-containing protein 1 isoform X2 [Denticeps clupeoides]|uniref:VPS9 domain containing 1 n=1 Tax=Denticeps clupeoides TaxID=299321 RepID=A0AAY4DIE5_9TELE|nr:VPS9 domain-containing protein 1 isoform X2 [Denticeps clupeoides]